VNSPSDDLDPARLEAVSFDLVRRGFDPTAVRGELQRAAQEIRRLRLERDELVGRLAEFDDISTGQLEAHRVAEALGVEATQVIEAAHLAASERAERAEREAEAVRDEALAAADATRAEAESERDALLDAARREAEKVMDDGRERGREMVAEAQAVRERMLRDLARKRQTGRAQVEQLRAGRDRLLESLTIAQQSLDTAVVDLVNSVPDARSAAERAGLRVASEPTPSPEELEGEIEAARLVGHPLVEGITDPGPIEDVFITAETEALTHLDVLDEDGADSAEGDRGESGDDGGGRDGGGGENDGGDTVDGDAVALYDVESEAAEAQTAESEVAEVETAEPEAADSETTEPEVAEAEVAETEVTEPSADEPEATLAEVEADDVFARLRSSQESAIDEEPAASEEMADGDLPEPVDDPVDATEEAAIAESPTADREMDEARAEARAKAAAAAAKAMKKVLVEEQGTLLDGIRRSGADAVRFVVDDSESLGGAYEKAASAALKELAADLGGSKRLGLAPALAQIRAIALEPMRQRLADVAARIEDPDELSDTVRALYRESRGRRIPDAAAAAAVAVDGLVMVARADGPVCWHVEPGGPCGPDCADNALAGAVEAGTEFPTGDTFPPAHPSCTCWLVASSAD
jgi:cell division septum initiation protein DivIVA